MTLIQKRILSKYTVNEQQLGNGSGPLECYQFSRQNAHGWRAENTTPILGPKIC